MINYASHISNQPPPLIHTPSPHTHHPSRTLPPLTHHPLPSHTHHPLTVSTLENSNTENKLRSVFVEVRESLTETIVNDLGNYRHKRVIGLAGMFNDHLLSSTSACTIWYHLIAWKSSIWVDIHVHLSVLQFSDGWSIWYGWPDGHIYLVYFDFFCRGYDQSQAHWGGVVNPGAWS